MKKISAWLRLLKWRQIQSQKVASNVLSVDNLEITDFDHKPYISWLDQDNNT